MDIRDLFLKLKQDLDNTNQKKQELTKSIKEITQLIISTQEKELKLRDDISQLALKEANLNAKRIGFNKQLCAVEEKLPKLEKIYKGLMFKKYKR